MSFFAQCYPPYQISPKSDEKHRFSNFGNFGPRKLFWKLRWSQTIEARTFCVVSLDRELSKLFLVLMSTSATFGLQNGPTLANFRKRKLETSFLQHESKIDNNLQFFPDNFLSIETMRDLVRSLKLDPFLGLYVYQFTCKLPKIDFFKAPFRTPPRTSYTL